MKYGFCLEGDCFCFFNFFFIKDAFDREIEKFLRDFTHVDDSTTAPVWLMLVPHGNVKGIKYHYMEEAV